MEYWTVEGDGKGVDVWNKKPFLPFPLPEGQNLAYILLEHWREHPEHHWIVFSNDETKEIKRLGAPFAAFHVDGILRLLVTEPLKGNRHGYVSATYVTIKEPSFKLGDSLQLGIEFNRNI